jgi:accessory colonization factor AcfC
MKEPLPQTALSLSLNNQGPSSKNFEIILYGTGCKNHIVAKMAKQYVRKTVHVDVTLYYYPINVSVKNNQNYTVYVPK